MLLFDVPRRQRRGRIQAAQAVVSRPRPLVLDEPAIGLDPLARASVWERVLELRPRRP